MDSEEVASSSDGGKRDNKREFSTFCFKNLVNADVSSNLGGGKLVFFINGRVSMMYCVFVCHWKWTTCCVLSGERVELNCVHQTAITSPLSLIGHIRAGQMLHAGWLTAAATGQ